MKRADRTSWLKIDRNIPKWRWFKTSNTFHVWMWLILSANIEEHNFQNEVIKRGEVATSYKTIADSTGLTPKMVLTAVDHLKRTGEVAVRRGANYLVISILNYDEYQAPGQGIGNSQGIPRELQGNAKGMTKELPCQQSKNIRNKELKNEKNMYVDPPPAETQKKSPSANEVIGYFTVKGRSRQDAEKFFAYNQGKGWRIGKTRITDWQAVADMWILGNQDTNPPAGYDPHPELDDFGRPIQPKYK